LLAALPFARATESMTGQKSVSAGAISSFPFHCGLARPMTDVGSCEALTLLGL
jgi:hypothetical protein